MLVRIEAPHFVAGIVMDWGRARRCAPVVKYMRGWTLAAVREYCARKLWRCEVL